MLYKVGKKGEMNYWTAWTVGNFVFKEWGQVGGKAQTDMYEASPKNVGRTNETSAEEQARVEVLALFKKQHDVKHYRPTQEEAQEFKGNCIVPRRIKKLQGLSLRRPNVLFHKT